MESKIKFDLNSQNEAVVSATIIFDSEDVRDKVARNFYEGLGHYSNLAHITIMPDIKIPGLLGGAMGAYANTEKTGRMIQIKTYGGTHQETIGLCENLCTEQLEVLLKIIPLELHKRKLEPSARIEYKTI